MFERWLTDNEQMEKKLSTATTPDKPPLDFSEWDPLRSNLSFKQQFSTIFFFQTTYSFNHSTMQVQVNRKFFGNILTVS